jgi:hypothetical protein
MCTHTPSPAPTDHDAAFITSSTYVSLDLGWVMILCFSYRYVLHLSALVSITRLWLANITDNLHPVAPTHALGPQIFTYSYLYYFLSYLISLWLFNINVYFAAFC